MKIKLEGCRLDEGPDLQSVVNSETYRTQGKSFVTRMRQLREIERHLRSVGFKRMHHHVSLSDEASDLYGAILGVIGARGYYVGMQTECYSRYSDQGDNNHGTIVELLPTYGGRYKRCRGLTIDVEKRGNFEDYTRTCNLFRRLFELQRKAGGK
jgi:hypothetical protein